MDRTSAANLIKITFNSPFDKAKFVPFVRNLFNSIDDAPFNYSGAYIPHSFMPYVNRYERVGKYKGDDENEIDILIVYLKRETSLERARSMQRNFIARYLVCHESVAHSIIPSSHLPVGFSREFGSR